MGDAKIEIAIDIGDSFAKGVFIKDGEMVTAKVLVVPEEGLSSSLVNCLKRGAERLKVSLKDLLNNTSKLRYSANAVLEKIIQNRSGARLGLIITKGFEDTLYGGDSALTPKKLFVPEELIVSIDEEVDRTGKLIGEVKEEEIYKVTKYLMERGAQAIAICLRNSYFNPLNEQRVNKIILEDVSKHYLGAVGTLCSHLVSCMDDDYVRLNTTVVNLFLHRNLARSFWEVDEELRSWGLTSHPRIMVSSIGGVRRVSKTRALDVMWGSPVGGLLGSSYMGKIYGEGNANIITVDVGDTKTYVGVIKDGGYECKLRPELEGIPVDVPTPAMNLISVGEYSVAIVTQGKLQVGPRSARPVCYDEGGTEPTVMDADLILGYLTPDSYGERKLNKEKAWQAIKDNIADKLYMTVEGVALSVREAAEAEIGKGILKHIAGCGDNPKDFAVYAYGGAGGGFCCGFANHVGAKKIVIFPFGSVFSAFGQITADILYWYSQPFHAELWEAHGKRYFDNYDTFNTLVKKMIEEANHDLRAEKVNKDDTKVTLNLTMRYKGGFERMLTVDKTLIESGSDVSKICKDFKRKYPLETKEDKDIELINVGVKIDSPAAYKVNFREHKTGKDVKPDAKGKRNVYWKGGYIQTDVYDYGSLKNGMTIKGPAIIEQEDATYVLPEGYKMKIDRYLNGIIEVS